LFFVIPAKEGIQTFIDMDPRLRGGDEGGAGVTGGERKEGKLKI